MQHCKASRYIFAVFGFATIVRHAVDTTIVILLTSTPRLGKRVSQ